jgi:hypothetical protein
MAFRLASITYQKSNPRFLDHPGDGIFTTLILKLRRLGNIYHFIKLNVLLFFTLQPIEFIIIFMFLKD